MFPNSNSFSHSKGFRAELLSGSPWFSGADPCWAAKRFCGRFDQGSAKVPPRSCQGSTTVSSRFHQGFAEFVLPRFHICLSNDCCFRKGSLLRGSANCSLHLTPSLVLGSKLHELLTCLTHTYTSNPQKTTHHVVAVGVFFGFILFRVWWFLICLLVTRFPSTI